MTALSLRNPIAVLMMSIAVVVFALVVTPRMPVDTFPELSPPVLVVGTMAPGLAAKDVEKAVTWRIERYVAATPGVDRVESLSRNNFSLVYVWLKWGTNLDSAQTLVQSMAMFGMAGAPKSLGLLPPFVLQYDPANTPVAQVVVSGSTYSGPQLYDYAENLIEPQLEGIAGVASAAPDGGQSRQINIVVDKVRAQARHLTTEDVAKAVARSNALLPAGELITDKLDANVYTNAIPRVVATIGDAPVKMVDGTRPVRISDVARVEDGGAPPTQSVSVDGHDAVCLNVMRTPGGNTIQIVDAVKAQVAHLVLPPGMKAQVFFDQSLFVRSTYHGLKKEIFQALVLICLVILLFLQSGRGTLIVSVAIPLAFSMTLIVLYASGQTLNAFTLGGLTLSMGLLVDSSVVVLESIHRHRRLGMSAEDAARAGAEAVALPMLASSLATIAVLLPVLLLTGLAKKLFVPLALTVAVSVIGAYFVSMMVTPVACRYFLGHAERRGLALRLEHAIDALAERYAALLRAVLPHRRAVVVTSLVLVAASALAATRLPSTFFPDLDEAMDMVYVRFAPGISVKEAGAQLARMGRAISRALPPGTVEMVIANNGMPQHARTMLLSPNVAPNTGFLRLAFSDPERRKLSQTELAVRIRHTLAAEFPGVEVLEAPGGLVANVFANGHPAPLVVELDGDDLDALDREARDVVDVARTIPGVRDVKESLQLDYPEVRVDTDRARAGFVGTSAREAAQTTLEATIGNINVPSVWVDASNGRAYYVVTSYDAAQVPDPQAMSELPVRFNGPGHPVFLGAYGKVYRSTGAVAVERSHLERVVRVLMQTEGRDLGSAANALEAALGRNPKTKHLRWRFVGQVELMRTTFSGLGLALGLAVMVVFMIMASQFKSLRLPFVMLFTVPATLIGIVIALLAAGQGLSITALMGMLMVIGIAVANGILLVAEANARLAQGATRLEAIVAGARARFVPILMTSVATVAGLLPTALALERGSEANQPLALVVVGGLISSTVLSLFLVPVMFLYLARTDQRA